MRTPRTLALAVVVGVLAVVAPSTEALAQSVTAEVRTWSGRDLVVTGPALEVSYNVIMEKDKAGTAPAADTVAAAAPLELRGSLHALSTFLKPDVVSRWGRRSLDEVTITKDGVETRIPVDRIQSLLFVRRLVTRNTLPPYHAPRHFRTAVTVILKDGSSLEADYVNLGTAVLTGMTPQGRVEIAWDEIEMVRFGLR